MNTSELNHQNFIANLRIITCTWYCRSARNVSEFGANLLLKAAEAVGCDEAVSRGSWESHKLPSKVRAQLVNKTACAIVLAVKPADSCSQAEAILVSENREV